MLFIIVHEMSYVYSSYVSVVDLESKKENLYAVFLFERNAIDLETSFGQREFSSLANNSTLFI